MWKSATGIVPHASGWISQPQGFWGIPTPGLMAFWHIMKGVKGARDLDRLIILLKRQRDKFRQVF